MQGRRQVLVQVSKCHFNCSKAHEQTSLLIFKSRMVLYCVEKSTAVFPESTESVEKQHVAIAQASSLVCAGHGRVHGNRHTDILVSLYNLLSFTYGIVHGTFFLLFFSGRVGGEEQPDVLRPVPFVSMKKRFFHFPKNGGVVCEGFLLFCS